MTFQQIIKESKKLTETEKERLLIQLLSSIKNSKKFINKIYNETTKTFLHSSSFIGINDKNEDEIWN